MKEELIKAINRNERYRVTNLDEHDKTYLDGYIEGLKYALDLCD